MASKKKQDGETGAARLDVTARLDRLRVGADYFPKEGLSGLPGFRCVYDYAPRSNRENRSQERSYGRVCRFVNDATGLQIEGQYEPLQSWLYPGTLTLVANDRTGLVREEVDSILELLEDSKLVLAEVALDFDIDSHVNARFVRRHLLCGKAHHRKSHRHPGHDWFGARRSPKFVRCYQKESIQAYRIEVEVHSVWLRKHRIVTTDDFSRFPALLPRQEIQFVSLDLEALERQLRRHGLPVETHLRRARELPDGLYAELRRLRQRVGLVNTHRLLN